MKEVFRTTKEWNKLGYRIKKGEHHTKRDATGSCLFSLSQVWAPSPSPDEHAGWNYEGSWEELGLEYGLGGPFD